MGKGWFQDALHKTMSRASEVRLSSVKIIHMPPSPIFELTQCWIQFTGWLLSPSWHFLGDVCELYGEAAVTVLDVLRRAIQGEVSTIPCSQAWLKPYLRQVLDMWCQMSRSCCATSSLLADHMARSIARRCRNSSTRQPLAPQVSCVVAYVSKTYTCFHMMSFRGDSVHGMAAFSWGRPRFAHASCV